MPDEQQIFLFPSAEVEKLLTANGIDLRKVVQRALPSVEIGLARDPVSKDTGERDLVTAILVSGVALAAIMPLLKDALRMACGRPTTTTDLVPVAVLDGEGKPLIGKDGEPIVRWAAVSKEASPAQAVSVKLPIGIEIKLGG